MKTINWKKLEKDLEKESLDKLVNKDNSFKELLLNYIGKKLNPKDNNITVDMIIKIMAEEFPEFLLAVAEQNWIRGYEQALQDHMKIFNEKLNNETSS